MKFLKSIIYIVTFINTIYNDCVIPECSYSPSHTPQSENQQAYYCSNSHVPDYVDETPSRFTNIIQFRETIKKGDLSTFVNLLNHGTNVHEADCLQNTPLHHAAMGNTPAHAIMIQRLLAHDSNPELRNNQALSPVHYAANTPLILNCFMKAAYGTEKPN